MDFAQALQAHASREGLPFENTSAGKLNIGVGTGYFISHTNTILAPVIDNDFWIRPGRH